MPKKTERKQRLAVFRIDSAEQTSWGALRVDAALTRTGILEYKTPRGIRKELRPSTEVFDADSLESLRGAAVTDFHPPEMVTPSNWKKYAIGHVSSDVREEGQFVMATLFIQDADIIEKIQSGERKELSAGYTAQIQFTPGENDADGRFDAIQTGIRYNHVSLLPEGHGRAGSEVSLRLDSKDNVIIEEKDDSIMSEETKVEETVSSEPIVEEVEEIKEDAAETRFSAIESRLAALEEAAKAPTPPPIPAPEAKQEPAPEVEKTDEIDFEALVEAKADERIEVLEAHKSLCGADKETKGVKTRQLCLDALDAALGAGKAEVRKDMSDESLVAMLEAVASVATKQEEKPVAKPASLSAYVAKTDSSVKATESISTLFDAYKG